MAFQVKSKITIILVAAICVLTMPHHYVEGFMPPSSFVNSISATTKLASMVETENDGGQKNHIRNKMPLSCLAMGASFLLMYSLPTMPAAAAASVVTATAETNYGTNYDALRRTSIKECNQFCQTSMIISNVELLDGTTTVPELSAGADGRTEKKPVKTNLAQEGGKGFFIIYVVFSFLAGGVEMTKRFQKWLENKQQ